MGAEKLCAVVPIDSAARQSTVHKRLQLEGSIVLGGSVMGCCNQPLSYSRISCCNSLSFPSTQCRMTQNDQVCSAANFAMRLSCTCSCNLGTVTPPWQHFPQVGQLTRQQLQLQWLLHTSSPHQSGWKRCRWRAPLRRPVSRHVCRSCFERELPPRLIKLLMYPSNVG